MTTTYTHNETLKSELNEQLARLNWDKDDARKDLLKAAEQLLWRANRLVEAAKLLVNDQPTTLELSLMGSDLQTARDTAGELVKIAEKERLIRHVGCKLGLELSLTRSVKKLLGE